MNFTSDPLELTFGRFRVLPDRRELLADGRPVTLGGRAFDVLMALIEARGSGVSKQALMARVWPGRIIEENSLAAQIAALHAAFGAERAPIRTVSGRGYQFTGDIRVVPASPGEPVGAVTAYPRAFLPGRDPAIGVVLTAAAIPLWMHLSLMEECRGCVEHALAALRTLRPRSSRT